MNPNETPNDASRIENEKSKRRARLINAIQPQGSGAVAWTERNRTRPSDYPLQPCDFKKWARYDSLPIEQACFVLLGFEPPPLHVLRFVQDTYNPSREPTWDEPPEYSDSLRSLRLSIAHGNISVQRITESPYETEHVSWLELVRWARLKSYTIPSELESIIAEIAPVALVSLEPQAAPVVTVGASGGVGPAKAGPVLKRETPAELNARRFKRCVDAGLTMPSNDYATLPIGIGALAKQEGISKQAFSKSVKKHLSTIKS